MKSAAGCTLSAAVGADQFAGSGLVRWEIRTVFVFGHPLLENQQSMPIEVQGRVIVLFGRHRRSHPSPAIAPKAEPGRRH